MLRKISKKKAQRIKEWKTEKAVFEIIRNNRKHECCICWKYIYEAHTYCFAHLAPKWTYPEHRLKEENIALVCSILCHNDIDKIYVWEKRAELVRELNNIN